MRYIEFSSGLRVVRGALHGPAAKGGYVPRRWSDRRRLLCKNDESDVNALKCGGKSGFEMLI